MPGAAAYCRKLTTAVGVAWNRFWFTPHDPAILCVLRILVGCAAFYYVASFTPDLTLWFGTRGVLPIESVRELTNDFHWSYLNHIHDDRTLWVVHVLALVVLGALVVGWWTPVAAALSLVVVLSYIHRAPMLAGQFEALLGFLLLYLCVGPCGRRYSLDQWLMARRGRPTAAPTPSVAAAISTRLMQVHLALLYAVAGLTKVAGETWWAGEAVWWLIAHRESRLIDLTFLHEWPFVINIWTHAILTFELAFAILIWNRLARPLLLVVAVGMWASLALISGLVGFCGLMIVANLCFVRADWPIKNLGRPSKSSSRGGP